MKYQKKSLGQNFLIDRNIAKKITNISKLKGTDVIEIGPGKGALTDEILKKNLKKLILIEKDNELFEYLIKKYKNYKNVKIINEDILNFDFKKISSKKLCIIGNLPYNISSQILIKILKTEEINKYLQDLIFMFQKELGEKITAKFPSKHYGRLSIITNFKFKIMKKFLVSPHCFFPKPKVVSMVIHFKSHQNKKFKIKDLSNLEKITNKLFSNKRKMINKNIRKILKDENIEKLKNLNLTLRPENISPDIFYKITEIYEKN